MRCLALAALLALSACDAVEEGGGILGALAIGPSGAEADQSPGPRSISLFRGDVEVRGPEGYCIDRRASRARTGFAVLAACARVAQADVVPVLDGFLTVQIGDEGSAIVSGNEPVLANLLEQEAGAGLLSEGDTPVAVEETRAAQGLVLVRYTDPEARAMQGTVPTGWRAFLDLSDRSAVISLRAFENSPLSEADGEILLRAAAAALTAANTDP